MDRNEQREAAIKRVEAAARELSDAQRALAELIDSPEQLSALVLHGEIRPAQQIADDSPGAIRPS